MMGGRSMGVGAAALALTLATVLSASGCSDDPSFEVGNCVRIVPHVLDEDLERAECAGAVGTFDPTERVYRVNEIIDGTDGGCPQLQGFFPVEFVHEPDGVTYCLVQQD